MEAHAAASGPETRAALSNDQKIAEAKRLYAEARDHKRKSEQHKRRARSSMRRFDEFRSDLEAMGIKVILEEPHMSKGGQQ